MLTLALASTLVASEPQVRITRDFIAEQNQKLAQIPSDQKAWPLWLRAIEASHPWNPNDPAEPFPHELRPGDPDWRRLEQWLAANSDAIEFIQQAARRPSVGIPLAVTHDPELARIKHLPPEPPPANPSLGHVLLPHLSEGRKFVRTLRLEARRAAHAGDSARTATMITSMIDLADQLLSEPTLIGQLAAYACLAQVCDAVAETIADHPDLLAAPDCARLKQRLRSVNRGQLIRPNVEFERLPLLDLMQRTFTDDGQGDGRMTVEGMRQIGRVAEFVLSAMEQRDPRDAGEHRWFERFAGQVASRKEVLAAFDQWLVLANQSLDRPLWESDWSAVKAQKAIMEDPIWRYMPASFMLPAAEKAHTTSWRIIQQIEATSTLLALAEFRSARGRWPDSLNELLPDHIDRFPLDVYVGDALIYHLRDGAPLLYARGVDHDDDGGMPINTDNTPFTTGWADRPPSERPSGDWILFPPSPPRKP